MKPPANLHPKLRNIVKRSQWPVTDRMMEMNKGSSGAASQKGSERSDSRIRHMSAKPLNHDEK